MTRHIARYLLGGLLFLCLTPCISESYSLKVLTQNFEKSKQGLIRLFEKSGVDAEKYFSDPRLKLHPEIWDRFVTQPSTLMTLESVERGKSVIVQNQEFLKSVEYRYGVPKEILISIYRVETNLGRNTGKYTVFNSLLTWVVSGHRRWKWAQQELVTFLIVCKKNNLDPFEVPSSTHGAFGLC